MAMFVVKGNKARSIHIIIIDKVMSVHFRLSRMIQMIQIFAHMGTRYGPKTLFRLYGCALMLILYGNMEVRFD